MSAMRHVGADSYISPLDIFFHLNMKNLVVPNFPYLEKILNKNSRKLIDMIVNTA